jgi:hypothetical protein
VFAPLVAVVWRYCTGLLETLNKLVGCDWVLGIPNLMCTRHITSLYLTPMLAHQPTVLCFGVVQFGVGTVPTFIPVLQRTVLCCIPMGYTTL